MTQNSPKQKISPEFVQKRGKKPRMLFQMEVSSTKHTAREAEGKAQMGPVSLPYTRARSVEGQAPGDQMPRSGSHWPPGTH